MKIILILLFLYLISNACGEKEGKEKIDKHLRRLKLKREYKNCSTADIGVNLIEISNFGTMYSHKGLVSINLPRIPRPLLLCYPSDHQYQQVTLLSHVICRQLGFMTIREIQQRNLHLGTVTEDGNSTTPLQVSKSLKPNSWTCSGHEQTVSQCAWNSIRFERCELVTELKCGNCQKSIKESEGHIKAPGYPLAYVYDVNCEWHIEVPDSHAINLFFHYHNAYSFEKTTHYCSSEMPYIELIYGTQGKFHIHRHCNFNDLNLTIPFNAITIRYFSGFYNPKYLKSLEEERGLSILFKSTSFSSSNSRRSLLILALILIFGFSIVAASWYNCREDKSIHPVIFAPEEVPPSNAPDEEELNRAYEFRRCSIQGRGRQETWKLNINGSQSMLPNLLYPVSTISNQVTSAFRKFSNTGTPLTAIPEMLQQNSYGNMAKLQVISNLKTKLLDRFSRSGEDVESDSSVFLPAEQSSDFQIYHSTSSEPRQRIARQSKEVYKETAI